MSYETYLHRSFDYQLSPVPSTIIDWANTRRAQRTVMPSSSPAGAAAARPLAESRHREPWAVSLAALEKAAALEATLRERHQRQQWALHQQQMVRHGHPSRMTGLTTQATPAALAYAVEDHHPRANGGLGLRAGAGVASLGAAAQVTYPMDSAMYAASTPEGEVLGLPNPFRPTPTPTAAAAAGGGGGGTAPLVSSTTIAAGPTAASAASGALGGRGAEGRNGGRPRLDGGAPAELALFTSTASAAAAGAGVGAAPLTLEGGAGGLAKAHVSPAASPPPPPLAPSGDGTLRPWLRAVGDSCRTVWDRWLYGSAETIPDLPLLTPRPAVALTDLVWGSYGSVPLWRRGTFAVSAGVYTAFGFTQERQWDLREGRPTPSPTTAAAAAAAAAEHSAVEGAGGLVSGEGAITALLAEVRREQQQQQQQQPLLLSPKAPAGSEVEVEVGHVTHSNAVRVLNVVQLEWYWALLRWQGVLNVRLLPAAEHTRVPVCEYVMRTPWTEWAVQSDALVLNWSGFLTLYQQRTPALLLARERLFHEQYGAAMQAEAARERGDQARDEALTPALRPPLRQRGAGGKGRTAKAEASVAGSPSDAAAATGASTTHGTSAMAPASVKGAEGGPDSSTPPHVKGAASTAAAYQPPPPQNQQQQQSQQQAVTPPPQSVPHWWALRHLKIGAGIAVKNDLASGVNLYWGCSGQTGRGLTFSGHVDVLRRMCCALSASHGPLDLSVRLRVNLITYHGTALDAGVCCRPWSDYPGVALRVSTAATGRCVGLQVDDITHTLFSGWIARHAEQRAARWLADKQRLTAVTAAGGPTAPAASPPPIVAAAASSHVSGRPEDAAANAEGGWISFGWATSAWGYLRGSPGGSEGAARERLAEEQQQQRARAEAEAAAAAAAAAAASSSAAARAAHLLQTAPRHALSVSRAWASWAARGLVVPPKVWDRAATAGRAVRATTVATWHGARRLDWLEALLDGANVDVSVGLVHDPKKGGSGLSSFLVISSH